MRTNTILLDRKILDRIIDEIREFEKTTDYKTYDKILRLVGKLGLDSDFDESTIIHIIWRVIKTKKGNKRIYRLLHDLEYEIEGGWSDD